MKVAEQERSTIGRAKSGTNIARWKFYGEYQYLKENLKRNKRIQYYMSETDIDKKGENSSIKRELEVMDEN